MTVPVLRVLGGLSFVLAGLLAYYNVTFSSSVFLLFIVAGAAVIVIAVSGHRPGGGDIAIFVLGILVLSAVTAGYTTTSGQTQTTYSATTGQVNADRIALSVRATTGSVSISFLNETDLAYQVNFTRPFGPFSVPFDTGKDTVTNSTSGGVFTLNVTSSISGVDVFLRHGYFVNISATTDTGSLSLTAHGSERLGSVSLSSSTGSVDAELESSTIQGLSLHTSTGSIDLESNHLGTGGRLVPVTVSTSLGSVSVRLDIQSGVAATVTATTNLGSLSHELTGFTISQDTRNNLVASAGEPGTAQASFVITSSTNLGSQDLTIAITG